MPLIPLLLVAVVLAVDNGVRPLGAQWGMSHVLVWLLAWAPPLLIFLASWIGHIWIDHRLARGKHHGSLAAADWLNRLARWGLIANHAAAVLIFDWLGVIRGQIGDRVL